MPSSTRTLDLIILSLFCDDFDCFHVERVRVTGLDCVTVLSVGLLHLPGKV